MMKKMWGGPGTRSGLTLRTGQFFFAAFSILTIVFAGEAHIGTPLGLLMEMMAFLVFWGFSLTCFDAYSLRTNADLQKKSVFFIAIGDWVVSTFTLAATCSATGIIVYLHDVRYCTTGNHLQCSMYDMALYFAFVAWGHLAISSHIILWIIASCSTNPHL